MNKIAMIALLVAMVLFSASVFAQDTTPSGSPSAAQTAMIQKMLAARYAARRGPMSPYPPSLMSKEKIEKVMRAFIEIGMLYKMLEQPTMVSTDGGVIVAYGGTLRKYDKDLNVVKEVDLDVNVDAMQDLASKFAKKYSAQFMDLMGPMAAGPSSASAGTSPPVSSTSASSSASGKPYDEQKEEEIKKEIQQMK